MSRAPFALLVALAIWLGSAAPAGAAERPARFDLAAGTVNGQTVLGKRMIAVTAAFGQPDRVTRYPQTTYLRWGAERTYRLLVGFRRQGAANVAVSIRLQSPALVETRLGRLLALSPTGIQALVRSAYADVFELSYEYSCLKAACVGSFRSLRGRGGFRFGRAGERAYIRISRP